MVSTCLHNSPTVYTIPYTQQRGLLPLWSFSQSVVADPLAYTLTHTVAYTIHLALTVAYTQHTVIYTYALVHTYTLTISSGAFVYIGF